MRSVTIPGYGRVTITATEQLTLAVTLSPSAARLAHLVELSPTHALMLADAIRAEAVPALREELADMERDALEAVAGAGRRLPTSAAEADRIIGALAVEEYERRAEAAGVAHNEELMRG